VTGAGSLVIQPNGQNLTPKHPLPIRRLNLVEIRQETAFSFGILRAGEHVEDDALYQPRLYIER
jgi:hypothetical protein